MELICLRLEKLEIFGFKSFARKVEVNFEPGITAIIGPNGSGKSNIVDSIRWVLGEQSAKSLRGSKMEDVIFVGSEHRKPLGMAQVALTLDNSDGFLDVPYGQVCIRRRVFRSGEGEYTINGKVCRLRDLAELLMNTGLGRDDYSIIDQRKVDAVLGSKPQERRLLLEEAAGIYKYRVRREESLRKLAETEDNSQRLGDILRELESRLEPLREDSQRAQEAGELDGEITKLSLWLLFQQFSKWQQNKTQAEESGAELERDCQLAQEKLTRIRSEAAEVSLKLEAQEEELAATLQEQSDLATSKERQEGDLRVGRERQNLLSAQRERLAKETEEVKAQAQELAARLAIVEAEENKAAGEQAGAQEQLNRAQQKLEQLLSESQAGSQQLESAKGELIDVLEALAGARNQENSFGEEGERLGLRRKRTDARGLEILQEKEELDANEAELKAREDQLKAQRAQTKAALTSLEEELEQEAGQHRELTGKLAGVRQTREQKRARLRALSEMERHFEGYWRGTRSVLERKGQLPGLIGPVADLISVPEKLEVAMETALGGGLQNIVTQDEAVAQQAIGLLRQNNWGRATFLPLSLLRPDRIRSLPSSPGILGLASDLIEYDPQYAPAVEYLLGRTVVAEDLASATKLARLTGSRYRVVTLQGDLISPGGAVSGGSREQRGAGLLARKRELEELEGELRSLEKSLVSLEEQEGEIATRLAQLGSKKEELAKAEQKGQLAAQDLERDRQEHLAALARLARQYEAVEAEKRELEEEAQQLEIKKETIAQRIVELELREGELRSQLAAGGMQQDHWQTQRLQAQEELASLRVQLASLSERTEQLRAQREELSSRLRLAREQVENTQKQEGDLKGELLELEANLAQLEHGLQSQGTSQTNLQEKLNQCRTRRTELRAELSRDNDAAREAQAALEGSQQSLHRWEVRTARLDAEGERLAGELLEKHDLTFEALSPELVPQLDLSLEEAPRRLKRLGAKRQELGLVNFGAIEELAEVEQRVTFLNTQLEDLAQARTSLLSLIEEIDGTSRQMLAATFEKVNEAFSTVFGKLFRGGQAHLELIGPEGEQVDPLTAGVEVLVQLPGKKQQNIQLLSGGERAFVAIAFLFSILKVHPSPFCVLDEIDAPLDEANLERFSALLRDFVPKTQFIIITHRRRTMEEADALWGVTMQEAGISQLLSVRLEDAV